MALALGALLLLVGSGLYVFRSLRAIPGEAAEAGRAAVQELRDLAAAFNQGTVEHRFLSYAASVEGQRRLQVATLEQTEVFELEDRATTLWGAIDLPTVRVRATAPVTYVYFVDLDERWELSLADGQVRAVVPPLGHNTPAVDPSEIRYEVELDSVLRDEAAVLEHLKQELAPRVDERAGEQVSLVRDTARLQLEGFVRSWLLSQFDDAEKYPVEIVFRDEEPTETPRPLVDPELVVPGSAAARRR